MNNMDTYMFFNYIEELELIANGNFLKLPIEVVYDVKLAASQIDKIYDNLLTEYYHNNIYNEKNVSFGLLEAKDIYTNAINEVNEYDYYEPKYETFRLEKGDNMIDKLFLKNINDLKLRINDITINNTNIDYVYFYNLIVIYNMLCHIETNLINHALDVDNYQYEVLASITADIDNIENAIKGKTR